MSELQSLYHDLILDHGRHPRHQGCIDDATFILRGDNPLCGDQLTLYLKLENDVVTDIKFSGEGCAISMASTSLMIEKCLGKTKADIKALFVAFHAMVVEAAPANETVLQKLVALQGVVQYPMRVKCATLAWHTFMEMFNDNVDTIVSTET